MGLHRGTTNNPGGRPKGSTNRSTTEIKKAFQNLLDSNIDKMGKDLQELTPKERIYVLLKLADFVLPKISSVQAEGAEGDNEIIIRRV